MRLPRVRAGDLSEPGKRCLVFSSGRVNGDQYRRAGSVAASGPFPNNITLTVLPLAAAVPGVTNTATVTGGNDCSLTNNASADVTLVATAVPTLSEWAMIALTMLLAAAGVIGLRGRRTVA